MLAAAEEQLDECGIDRRALLALLSATSKPPKQMWTTCNWLDTSMAAASTVNTQSGTTAGGGESVAPAPVDYSEALASWTSVSLHKGTEDARRAHHAHGYGHGHGHGHDKKKQKACGVGCLTSWRNNWIFR